MLPSWWTVGGCGSLGVSEEMGLSDVVDKKGSAILLYLHSMVKNTDVFPIFSFFRRWDSCLEPFIGYFFGISRNRASAIFYDTAIRKGAVLWEPYANG